MGQGHEGSSALLSDGKLRPVRWRKMGGRAIHAGRVRGDLVGAHVLLFCDVSYITWIHYQEVDRLGLLQDPETVPTCGRCLNALLLIEDVEVRTAKKVHDHLEREGWMPTGAPGRERLLREIRE